MTFFIFLKAIRDIGNIIAVSDRPNYNSNIKKKFKDL